MTDITLENLLENQSVSTTDPQLVVQMPNNKLKVGKHSFSLTVEDDSGNTSLPATITVIVVDSEAPTAVLDLHDEQGRTITDGRVSFGAGFILSGKRSADIGGTIVKYVWEVVPQ
jgi:PKD repeat protein